MATNSQNEPKLPLSKNETRSSSDLLPRFYRTESNKKFLKSTIDQLIQPGTVKKLNGYIGRQFAKSATASDLFLSATDKERQDYQLEPAAVIQDYLGNTSFYKDYIDHINHVDVFGGNVDNLERVDRQEFYSWNPHINWDKFVNFQQYYWLPYGPPTVSIPGQQKEIISTYTVKTVDEGDNYAFIFTPNGLSRNPTLTFYRGQTYHIEITAKDNPFSIKTIRSTGDLDRYKDGISGWAIEKGTITFTVPDNAPDILFYQSESNIDTGGIIKVFDITENTFLDVSADILGKKTYTAANKISLTNGLKVKFTGKVTPEIYSSGSWYVEGVGSNITLVSERDLEIVGPYAAEKSTLFDNEKFDQIPFSATSSYALYKDYITIARSSLDRNAWSRYNRWFHKDVIIASYTANNSPIELDQTARAVRPIIEFEPGLKLFNFGYQAKENVDLVDTFTTDVFSTIEGSIGYNIDGIDLAKGMRVLFTADTDSFVKNKIFTVDFIDVDNPSRQIEFSPVLNYDYILGVFNFDQPHSLVTGNQLVYLNNNNSNIPGLENRETYYVLVTGPTSVELYTTNTLTTKVNINEGGTGFHKFEVSAGSRLQITLTEASDSVPVDQETVLVNFGENYQGKMFWYNPTSDKWVLGQYKNSINQAPLFDVVDSNGNSFGDTAYYDGSTFAGTKLFSYDIGSGTADKELGFSLSYQNINNVGDIKFSFDLLKDTFEYKENTVVNSRCTDVGYLKIVNDIKEFRYENGWIKSDIINTQPIVRVFKESGLTNNFPVDVFDDVSKLNDLLIKVYVNGKRLYKNEFTVIDSIVRKIVILNANVLTTDIVTLECYSAQAKNENGHYKIPINLQHNPLNNNITGFTLGQVIDHVDSIISNVDKFNGVYPGDSNIRDLGYISQFGTKFVQHSAPLNLSLYHFGSKTSNIVKALEKARNDYGKFKRAFLVTSESTGIDTDPKQHVDFILTQMSANRPKTQPYYLSDMFGFSGSVRNSFTVLDADTKIYSLVTNFNLATLSNRAVGIYLNGEQLIHGQDYVFGDDVFFNVLTNLSEGDELEVYEYTSTDGTFCPPTPTKLGLYPKYIPEIFIDNTYLEPVKMIRGHDGSLTVAYNDYRDELILELEKRIFNNIKVEYDPTIFDIFDFIPGYSRKVDYSKQEFDTIMAPMFYDWTSNINQDFTEYSFFDRLNSFTFNYRGNYTPNGYDSPAWWRGIYKWTLDTDTPHLTPWECLGFSIKPRWWESVYGPAPYTSDNLILWDDIKTGTIREPGLPVRRNEKFAKDIINTGAPVTDDGRLLSPLDANYTQGYIKSSSEGYFVFGDVSPVEATWKKSSYYPFALIETILLMSPSRTLGICLDRSRIIKNNNNQFVYKDTNLRLRLKDIVLPSTVSSTTRIFTSGLLNYIVDYIIGDINASVDSYLTDLSLLTNKLGSKLGGFTSKPKYKLLLDSKNPTASSGVFVPEENYDIVLNTSSPIRKVVYSGVMITKYPDGFELRGYNTDSPYFIYHPWEQSDRLIKIGGISESFVEWESGKFYIVGKIIRASGQYWRVKETHTSGETFDVGYFVKLAELPVIGGTEAIFRKTWNSNVELQLGYATKLPTIQDVVDFLLGYGAYLRNQGFVFSEFNTELATVSDWETSAKEFMFWTTQNWAEGAVLSISPAANQLTLNTGVAVVQNILDPFYDYKIFRVDGKKLEPEFTDVSRDDYYFSINTVNAVHGIYGATLYLVQKEHVLILDNTTMFNDILYDVNPGYKQDRLKVLGYITKNWSGGFNIPGFIFDEAKIKIWEPWTDYSLGDIVKYKEFYYSANLFLIGTAEFDATSWTILQEKPTPQLIPNWDYKADQFLDYYDLDTDNFDVEQQKLAQHLIGYQKRSYLENIIKDDVSQYKFYQGMIIEKGTSNVLSKLFDVLSADGEESLIFDEEWAVRVGTYGATQAYDEVEFTLDESVFKVNPQPLDLVKEIDPKLVDFVYRLLPGQIYVKPFGNINPWPVDSYVQYLRSPGYVRYDDVALSIDTIDEVLNYNINGFKDGDYIWCAFEGVSWNVYRLTDARFNIENLTYSGKTLSIVADRIPKINAGDIVGIDNVSDSANGFYKVKSVSNRTISMESKTIVGWEEPFVNNGALCYVLRSNRVQTYKNINDAVTYRIKPNELFWVDNNATNNWEVLTNSTVFSIDTSMDNSIEATNGKNLGKKVVITKNGLLSVASDNEQVIVFEKTSATSWSTSKVIVKESGVADATDGFGEQMAISPDGIWLVVAAPRASNVKTVNDSFDIDVSSAGTPSGLMKQGYVNLYKRSTYTGIFRLLGSFVSSSPVDNGMFGSTLSIEKVNDTYVLLVSSVLNSTGKVEKFIISGSSWSRSTIFDSPQTNCKYGTSTAILSNNIVAISAPNYNTVGAVFVYSNDQLLDTIHAATVVDFEFNTIYQPNTVVRYNNILYITVNTVNTGIDKTPANDNVDFNRYGSRSFGHSISLVNNNTSTLLAISDPQYDKKYLDEGKVFLYKLISTEFVLTQEITSTKSEQSEKFGTYVSFSQTGDILAIHSSNGDVENIITFDNTLTTFDNNTTIITDKFADVGRVDVYFDYDTNYVFGESLRADNSPLTADAYGASMAVSSNTILVGAPSDSDIVTAGGSVYSYTRAANAKSWSIRHYNRPRPNISKMKKAYLYNKVTNQLITYLDIVDPIQGKIAGYADQELSFKTYFDPAVYSIGTSNVNVDDGLNWTKDQVGMLWWDLTRARFIENQGGEVIYRSTNWNKLYKSASIDIYEWVESKLKPSEWDKIADTEKGLTQGISGKSRYGNDVYSVKRRYDTISGTFAETYYYWVKNKTTVPLTVGRTLSARDVSNLIADPVSSGYSCIGFIGSSSFTMSNFERLLSDKDVALNVQYWNIDNHGLNAHSQWKLISENTNTIIPVNIETKWVDSLVGKDEFGRSVPDMNLPVKQRYGVEFRPRQSMFVNRIEAVKQFVERANLALLTQLIVDEYDISRLTESDPTPSAVSGKWDVTIDTDAELRFIGTANLVPAQFSATIENGKIVNVAILDPGYGYVNAPHIKVVGVGTGAKLQTVLDSVGRVTAVNIIEAGTDYNESTYLSIRSFAALVLSDSTSYDRWSIYTWNKNSKVWVKTATQAFDVNKFWTYADWYATGYNQFVKIDKVVDNTYQLVTIPSNIGDVIKVNHVGTGGWMLVEKYNNVFTINYSENFRVIAREAGTIQLSNKLYTFNSTTLGFDGPLFDADTFDNYPSTELRIILETIRDVLFVDELYADYLKLFFASVRYALSEQSFIDWAFKTSMVKARHNVGALKQKVTYSSDNLSSFEDYLKEVKPYRTKIREFVSTYNKIENSSTSVTDFDLLPVVGEDYSVTPMRVSLLNDGSIDASGAEINLHPWKFWLDNVGFTVITVELVDGGSGYINNPVVNVVGGFGQGCEVKAYIANGSVNRLELITQGTGYLKAPTLEFTGGLSTTGTPAKAVAIIESEVVRANKISIKFDRLSKNYFVSELTHTEQFFGTGSRILYPLVWSPNTKFGTSKVTVNNLEVLRGDYTLEKKVSVIDGKIVYSGLLTFETPPEDESIIVIEYEKDFNHMSAVDRINFFYNPQSGQLGKDLAQLMTGVDYGGVIISGLDFGIAGGWDSMPWFSDAWDSFDASFDDYIVTVGDQTRTFILPYVPALNEEINIYVNGIRVDGTDKQMDTFVGDGVTDSITIPNTVDLISGDKIIFRKSTSDGSIAPSSSEYDTQLSGGAFNGTTLQSATGLSPDDINIDGDGFVTPMTSNAPEEVVPGQIMDAVAIKVFHRPIANSPKIIFKNFICDGSLAVFKIGQQLPTERSVIVKVATHILEMSDYIINWRDNTVTLTTVPPIGTIVSVISFGSNSSTLLDADYFISDGQTNEFVTKAPWLTSGLHSVVLVDGQVVDYVLFMTDESYFSPDLVGIRFANPVVEGAIINYLIDTQESTSIVHQHASIVKSQELIIQEGIDTYNLTNLTAEALSVQGLKPFEINVIVRKDQEILNPSTVLYFTMENNNLTYVIPRYRFLEYSVDAADIRVFIHGTQISPVTDYVVDLFGITITIAELVYEEGVQLAVVFDIGEDYRINDNGTITFTTPQTTGSVVEVISFYNHSTLDINRTKDGLIPQVVLQPGTVDYYEFTNKFGGNFVLTRPAESEDYVWVIKNKQLLTHSIDYVLDSDYLTIKLKDSLVSTDIVQIVLFGHDPVQGSFGYMQFKDMLNRVHYKRLNKSKTTKLVKDLTPFDMQIHVEDGSRLSTPLREINVPGVIEINGERIEYFSKTGNVLSQLRRGTLGTSTPEKHRFGLFVIDLSASETIPYADQQLVATSYADGSTTDIAVDYVPTISTNDSWYRNTIPETHGQSNEVDVFVGGFRLKKVPYQIYNEANNQPYSPEGDTQYEADFSVDGQTNYVRLTNIVPDNTQITIVKKVGRSWNSTGKALADSTTPAANFLKNVETIWPQYLVDKYQYVLDADQNITLNTDDDTPLELD